MFVIDLVTGPGKGPPNVLWLLSGSSQVSCSRHAISGPSASAVVTKSKSIVGGKEFSTDSAAMVWSVSSARDKSAFTDCKMTFHASMSQTSDKIWQCRT